MFANANTCTNFEAVGGVRGGSDSSTVYNAHTYYIYYLKGMGGGGGGSGTFAGNIQRLPCRVYNIW